MTRPDKRDMPVVILCGGQGTRLREETEYRPKPMVEIGPQPILWHIMKIYGAHGLDRFVLCLGYKGWEIKQYFLRYREMHCDFTVSMDGEPAARASTTRTATSTGRSPAPRPAPTPAPARASGWCEITSRRQTFCFTYGDAVGDVDIDALLDFHRSQGRLATVTGVHPTSRYGEMQVDGGRVVEFNEKPTRREGVVSGGFFVFQREVLRLPERRPAALPRARAAAAAGAATASSRSTCTRASGIRWTPTATMHLTSSGVRQPPWKIW